MLNLYCKKKELERISTDEFLSIFPQEKPVISLVGAGGKSTLQQLIAQEFSRLGRKVLSTTTTHIYKPLDGHYARNLPVAQSLWKSGKYAVVGEDEGEKLGMLPLESLKTYMESGEVVLMEADGAKKMPMKLPRLGEPVILSESNFLLMVLGLSAVGKPLSQVCFRQELAEEILRKSGDDIVSPEDLIGVIQYYFKRESITKDYAVILSQCNTKELKKLGVSMINTLQEMGYENLFLFEKKEMSQ